MEQVDLKYVFMAPAAMNKMLTVINNTFGLKYQGRFSAGVGSSTQLRYKRLCPLTLALILAVYLLGHPWWEQHCDRGKVFVSKSETEKRQLPVS